MKDIKNDSHIDGSSQSEISLQVNAITTRPTFKAFVGLLRGQNAPKWAQNGLKMGSFHPFVHHKWSRMFFGKTRF